MDRADAFKIGSRVRVARAPKRSTKNHTGIAIISTIDENDAGLKVVSLMFESVHPQCNRSGSSFQITPNIRTPPHESEELDEVPLNELDHLLDFEVSESINKDGIGSKVETNPTTWKERGDQLFRLCDFKCAIEMYEFALSCGSKIEVGATIIVNRGGRPVLAEIDCMDTNDAGNSSLDVTYVEDGEDVVIQDGKVLLVVFDNDTKDRIQERILLNLARCLLRLADITSEKDYVAPPKYRKGAVLACSLALTSNEFNNLSLSDNGGILVNINAQEKARLLRAKAYLGLGKMKHAMIDSSVVLKSSPKHKEALHLVAKIKSESIARKRTDRNIAKEMCAWVHETSIFDSDTGKKSSGVVSEVRETNGVDSNECKHSTNTNRSPFLSIPAVILLFVVIGIQLLRCYLSPYETRKLPLSSDESNTHGTRSSKISNSSSKGFCEYLSTVVGIKYV